MFFVQSDTRNHVNTTTAYAACEAAYFSGVELPDCVALTIAAMWQSPGSIGKWFAMLASTGSAPMPYLMDDIRLTRRETNDTRDILCLDLMATWALGKARAVTTADIAASPCDCCGMHDADMFPSTLTEVNLCTACDDQYCEPTIHRDRHTGVYSTRQSLFCDVVAIAVPV